LLDLRGLFKAGERVGREGKGKERKMRDKKDSRKCSPFFSEINFWLRLWCGKW